MSPKALLSNLFRVITGKHGHPAGEFNNRIKARHRKFWRAADAEIVRNTLMHATDPDSRWKDAPK